MSRYASTTQVPFDRTRAEIERALSNYGASEFGYGYNDDRAMVAFTIDGRHVRMWLPLPDREDREFCRTPTGKLRTSESARTEYDRAVRQRWRALLLVIKAKLEAIESGITTLDEEFLAHLVLPDNTTVAQTVLPKLQQAYADNGVPELLPSYGGSEVAR